MEDIAIATFILWIISFWQKELILVYCKCGINPKVPALKQSQLWIAFLPIQALTELEEENIRQLPLNFTMLDPKNSNMKDGGKRLFYGCVVKWTKERGKLHARIY